MLYHGPGSCPKCFRPLLLIDKEINAMELDKSGVVVNFRDTLNECIGLCEYCGHTQPMMRSQGIYKPYSEIVKTIDMLEYKEYIKQCEQNSRCETNPLGSFY